MIVLDTNVLSEMMKASPSAGVARWLAAQPATSLYTTAVTQAEILHGVMLLPAGRRRGAIEKAAEAMFDEDFAAGSCLSAATRRGSTRASPRTAAGPGGRSRISMLKSPRSRAPPERPLRPATSRTTTAAASK